MDLGYLNLRDKVRKLFEKKHNGKSLYDLEFGSIFSNRTKKRIMTKRKWMLDIKTEKFCVLKNTKKVKRGHIFNRMKENICNHI